MANPRQPAAVFQVLPLCIAGGAEKLALTFHRKSLAAGYRSTAIALSGPPLDEPGVISLGFASPRHPMVPWRLSRTLRRLADGEACLIHTHLFPDQLYTPWAVRLSGLPAVMLTTEHSDSNRRRNAPGGRLIDRFLFRPYGVIGCISQTVRDVMATWLPEYADRLTVIENGIELDRYAMPDRAARSGGPTVIISTGRLVPVKNHAAAIAAIARLGHLDIEYRIVGAGPLEAELRAQVDQAGLAARVKFLGFRNDVPACLQTADILLMPSRYEGFGLSAVEAMACGLPVVASDVPGLREVLGDDDACGFLVNGDAIGDLAARIEQLVAAPDLRLRMGAAGRVRASRYSLERTMRGYHDLYARLLPASSPLSNGAE